LCQAAQLIIATPFVVVSEALLMVAADESWTATSLTKAIGPGSIALVLLFLGALISADHGSATDRPAPRFYTIGMYVWLVLLVVVALMTIELAEPSVTFWATLLLVIAPFAGVRRSANLGSH
jgi:hypothetical protein